MMCQRECLAGEQCEHIAICRPPQPPVRRDTKLCTCECPECGCEVRFDIEMDFTTTMPYSMGLGCAEFYVDCPRCGATITIEAEAKIAAVSVRY